MSTAWPGPGRGDAGAFDVHAALTELRERNPNVVAIDVLYLLTTAFFTHLALRGFWATAIAAIPLVTLLYFGWESSRAFFGAQLVLIVATVVATVAGIVPL